MYFLTYFLNITLTLEALKGGGGEGEEALAQLFLVCEHIF